MSYHFAARGFWLPCDQAHFFHHENHKDFRVATDLATMDRSEQQNKLDDQVYHRLAMVLGQWGFTHAIPVYHSERQYGHDPDAGVFIHEQFAGEPLEVVHETDKRCEVTLPAGVKMAGLALLVNSSGFYLVLARYIGEFALTHPHKAEEGVQEYLRWYIYNLVGGNFASRYSGWDDDRYLVTDQYEIDHTLQDYARNWQGMLTFDQINTIFEGLYSSALDFEVFFYDSESVKQERVRQVKRGYSLGRFVDLISTEVRSGEYGRYAPPDNVWTEKRRSADEPHAEHLAEFLHTLNTLHPWASHGKPLAKRSTGEEAHYLCQDFLGMWGCGVLLRKFLQATAASSLQEYKRRVERCRRALVTEILEVTQRQDPLVQVEVPDTGTNRIVGVNEAQLRGYVLLFSAKLPLIKNVRLYLDEITEVNAWYRPGRIGADQEKTEAGGVPQQSGIQEEGKAGGHSDGLKKLRSEAEREVAASLTLWRTLFAALESDVQGLEHAIEQERMDTMVREETKVRVEQETLAEIERLQDRTSKSLSPRQALTISALANIFALFSVVIALLEVVNVIGIGTRQTNLGPTSMSVWPALLSNLSWGTGLVFLGAVAGLGLLYWLIHEAVAVVLAEIAQLLKRVHIHLGERFYYEMDIHMEVPLDSALASQLLVGEFPLLEDGAEEDSSQAKAAKEAAAKEQAARAAARAAGGWLARGNYFWYQAGGLARRIGRVLLPRIWWGVWQGWLRKRARAFTDIERNSYRVERMTANEAGHKIYVEGTLRLPGTQGFWRRQPRIPVILVYELLFHRPTEAHRFILQDLRVVSTNPLALTGAQLAFIKAAVARQFVNPFISKASEKQANAVTAARQARGIRWKATENVPADALMSLTGEVETLQRVELSLRRRLWLSLLRAVHEVLMLGGLGAAIYAVRALIVAGEQVGPHGLQILFDGNTLVHTLALDEVGQLLGEAWWVMLLPTGLVALLTLLFTVVGAVKQRRAQEKAVQQEKAEKERLEKEEAERRDGGGGQGRQGEPTAEENAQPETPPETQQEAPMTKTLAPMGMGTRVAGVLGLLAIGVLQWLRVMVLLGLATAGIVACVPVLGDLWQLLVDHVWR